MKYNTLEELVAAVKAEQLPKTYTEDGDTYPVTLRIDNDDTVVYVGEGAVFRMHPVPLLEEALTLLGVPWEEE